MKIFNSLMVLGVVLLLGASLVSAEQYVYTIVLEDHKFTPSELIVPIGQKIQLVIENRDNTAEEFESDELKREKMIGASKSVTILIGPLEAGTYSFVGEFHKDTAKGSIVAAEEYQGSDE